MANLHCICNVMFPLQNCIREVSSGVPQAGLAVENSRWRGKAGNRRCRWGTGWRGRTRSRAGCWRQQTSGAIASGTHIGIPTPSPMESGPLQLRRYISGIIMLLWHYYVIIIIMLLLLSCCCMVLCMLFRRRYCGNFVN